MSALSAAPAWRPSASNVTCVDNAAEKIARLNAGGLPIYEPGLAAVVGEGVAQGRLRFTTDLEDALRHTDVVMIAVGTPTRKLDGNADLRFVYAAAEQIGRALDHYAVVVTKSTVPAGTGFEVKRIISQANPALEFDIASNPEFLREGNAVFDFMNPDRIVIGTESDRARAVMEADLPAIWRKGRRADLHRHRLVRTHQIRRQHIPCHQGQLHQRGCGSLREGRRQHRGRRPRHGQRPPHRPRFPEAGPRLRRFLLSQGHAGDGATSASAPSARRRSSRP